MMYTRKFVLPEEIQIINYLNEIEFTGYYKRNNISSIDQKCTFDILHLNAKCIIHFCQNNIEREFAVKDFFESIYTMTLYKNKTKDNGKAIVRDGTLNEYDKIFGNTFEMLSYADILEKKYIGRERMFKIKNYEILNLLSTSEEACVAFICHFVYLLVRNDEIIFNCIEELIKNPYNENVKRNFKQSTISWIKSNSNRNKDSSQISQKINNPLFYLFELKKYNASKKMKTIPQGIKDLAYFRIHRRDQSKKYGMTRREFSILSEDQDNNKSQNSEEIVKKTIRQANEEYARILNIPYKNISEWTKKELIDGSHVHHIWPKSFWDSEKEDLTWLHRNMYENLIVLSINEHYGKAHLKGKTKIISLENLDELLINQYEKIRILEKNKNKIYDPRKFYSLLCYIKNINEEEKVRNFDREKFEEVIYRYIEDILI